MLSLSFILDSTPVLGVLSRMTKDLTFKTIIFNIVLKRCFRLCNCLCACSHDFLNMSEGRFFVLFSFVFDDDELMAVIY